MSNASVRLAQTADDKRAVYALLMRMHEEVARAPVSPRKVAMMIERLADAGTLIIAERNDEIIGSLGLVFDTWWYSDAPLITERWFYVAPDARASGAALEMLRTAQAISEGLGTPLLLAMTTAHRPDVYERFLARRGFEKTGALMLSKGET